MFLRGHMQNAYVTHNLDKAMEIVADRFGVEKFDRFNPDMVIDTPMGHKPMVSRIASFWAGMTNIEIIEPVSGYVDHYVSMLPDDKNDAVPRFHHVSLRRDDLDEMRAEIARLGLPLAFEGPVSIKDPIPSPSHPTRPAVSTAPETMSELQKSRTSYNRHHCPEIDAEIGYQGKHPSRCA